MFEQSELTLRNLILLLVLGVCSASLLGACRGAMGGVDVEIKCCLRFDVRFLLARSYVPRSEQQSIN